MNNPNTSPNHLVAMPQKLSGDAKTAALKQAALSSLRHWWKIVFPLALVLAVGAAVGVYLTFEPTYMATATVEIKDVAPHVVFPEVHGRTSQRFVKTQQALLGSRLVMGPVVSRAEIAKMPEVAELDEPVTELARSVSFRSRSASNLYDIGYVEPNAKNPAIIVNAGVDAYFKLRDEHEAEQTGGVIEQLERERTIHAQKVTRLRNTVLEMTKDNPEAREGETQGETDVASPLAILRSRLTDQEVNQAMLRAELAALKEIDKENPVDVKEDEIEYVLAGHEEVVGLQERIAQKQQKRRDISAVLVNAKNDPRHVELTAEIKRDEQLLTSTRDDLRKETREALLKQREKTRTTTIETKTANLDALTVLHGILQERLENEIERTTGVNVDNLELEFKRDELNRAGMVYALLAQRVQKLQTEQRAPRQIERRMEAVTPKRPLEEYPLMLMALAGGVAFCCPLLLAFGWEWRIQRLINADQLVAYSNVPIVAEIACFPGRARSNSRALSNRVSRALRQFEESVHNLRTYLVLSEPLAGVRVLAVTSSISQEGKTSVATQLALSFARSGGNVLLIDGDMRSPDIDTIFDVERGPGLAEVLEGQSTVDEAIYRDWSDDIHILPAGVLSSEPHQLVGNGAVEQLIEKLRGVYSMIIIDTPPVLAASEALVMARAADISLLCTMRDTSRVSQVTTTHKRLVDAGAKPVGAVFSGVPVGSYGYAYGSYDYTREN